MKKISLHEINGENYKLFIDYCIKSSDYFMLAYVRYQMHPHSKKTKYIKQALSPFKVKKRNNPGWPGTIFTYTKHTEYQIIFYRCCEEAKKVLLEVDDIFAWTRPSMPQDLAFFRGNKCWFYSTGHEEMATVADPTQEDILFLDDLKVCKSIFESSAEPYYEDLTSNT